MPRLNVNVSYAEPVNRPGDEPVLTFDDVWQGIVDGAHNPPSMASYVASCEILSESEDKLKFRRKLILANGAVHTGAGEAIIQDVIVRPKMNVEAKTVDTGAATTFGVTLGTGEQDPERPDIYLVTAYELWMDGVEEGSKEAEDVRVNYRALARNATIDGVKTFRRWKVEGKIGNKS
ncbi:hypothetical protein MFIFM68171_07643 [Madurella fahalii]|uniref:Uncharacterized protein n=1 Tax=Madurella fahalii TaxID=1157608 RepID=A0ABQ0GI48_9PEZI